MGTKKLLGLFLLYIFSFSLIAPPIEWEVLLNLPMQAKFPEYKNEFLKLEALLYKAQFSFLKSLDRYWIFHQKQKNEEHYKDYLFDAHLECIKEGREFLIIILALYKKIEIIRSVIENMLSSSNYAEFFKEHTVIPQKLLLQNNFLVQRLISLKNVVTLFTFFMITLVLDLEGDKEENYHNILELISQVEAQMQIKIVPPLTKQEYLAKNNLTFVAEKEYEKVILKLNEIDYDSAFLYNHIKNIQSEIAKLYNGLRTSLRLLIISMKNKSSKNLSSHRFYSLNMVHDLIFELKELGFCWNGMGSYKSQFKEPLAKQTTQSIHILHELEKMLSNKNPTIEIIVKKMQELHKVIPLSKLLEK